ncbi:MAG TPA: DUF3300 domain-containing protein [Acetobacteraceae bacterium]|nr:DUF3300 domain-containing protein [Acetobacteraceae bacterium]
MAFKRSLVLTLCGSMALAAGTQAYATETTAPLPTVVTPAAASVPPENPADLQQLVAPIALYPDPLLAQILAASTYPAEIVEAQRWMAQHPGLQGTELLDAVNQQPWDPSVKAVAAFPSVLANMSRNLSWTVSLGQAYVEQSQAVLNAIQDMRLRAQDAGNLQSTPQEIVGTQGQTISIEPTNPEVVYVPEYDPWLVYGPPLVAWPDWYSEPGLYLATPGIVFGLGFGIGALAAFGWGWHHWGMNWTQQRLEFNHYAFVSRGARFMDHRAMPAPHFGERFGHVAGGFHQFGGAHFDGGFHRLGGANHFGGTSRRFGAVNHFAGGFNHFGGFQHLAGGFHAGGFHVGGFHGGGFHGGGFHGGGRR